MYVHACIHVCVQAHVGRLEAVDGNSSSSLFAGTLYQALTARFHHNVPELSIWQLIWYIHDLHIWICGLIHT